MDFQNSTYIRSHYLSILAQALELKKLENKTIKLIEPLNIKIKKDLVDIGFSSKYSNKENIVNLDNNMISLINIKKEDEAYYHFLLDTMHKLNGKINNLSVELSNKIMQKITELFNNVFRHSQSKSGFFCSGKFDNSLKIFNFTIVDNGVSIKEKVNEYFKSLKKQNKERFDFSKYKEIDGIEAIKWAYEYGNSTTGKGGFGLNLLKEFISKSKGRLEIISNDGYIKINKGIIEQEYLDKSFDGTIVSIGLSVDDSRFYSLSEENENDN